MEFSLNPSKSLYLKWFMVICLFTPGMISTFGLLIEQLLTMALFVMSAIVIAMSKVKLPRFILGFSVLYLTIFYLLYSTSLLRSADIFISNDIVEIIKPFYFFSFFLLPFSFKLDDCELESIVKFFIACCSILVIWAIIEAWTHLGYVFSKTFYKADRSVLINKAVGPFIITYVFASFLVMPFFYFFISALTKSSKTHYVMSLFCFFAIVSTQSKTVIVSLIFTLCLFLLLYSIYSHTKGKKSLYLIFSIIIVTLVVSIGFLMSIFESKLSYIYHGLGIVIQGLIDGGFERAINATPSVSLRYEQLMYAIEHQDAIPLIGVAIGKGVLMPESIYAFYLFRTGLVGLILHFFLVLVLMYLSYKNSKYYASNNKVLYAFFMSLHFYALSLPLSYFSSALNDQTRTGFFFYMFIGLSLMVYLQNQKLVGKKNALN